MQSFKTTITIQAPRPYVFKAISTKEGIGSWWTDDCKIDKETGGKAEFHFGEMYVIFQIEKLVHDRELVWRCIDQNLKFENVLRTNEWLGTVVDFHLEDIGGTATLLQFTHEGLTPELAGYDQSAQLWESLLILGLKKYLEKNRPRL